MIRDVYGQGPKKYKGTEVYKEFKNGKPSICPVCKLRPLAWIFDNGAFTCCGCGENDYDHFKIRTESINSIYNRLGRATLPKDDIEYIEDLSSTEDRLLHNWEVWVESGCDLYNKKKTLYKDVF